MGWFGFKRGSHVASAKSTKEVAESRKEQQDLNPEEDNFNKINDYLDSLKNSDNSTNENNGLNEINHGPWDISDENVPDYSNYLDLGAFYLPFLQGISLRLKKHSETNQVIGAIATYGSSSVEIEAFAAPKSTGIWDEVRKELLENNNEITETDGVFGKELLLPVQIEGKTIQTRFVGVDGVRWMIRGVFSGTAADVSMKDSDETVALNKWFASIVVDRGEEPMAPRDFIPMHEPTIAKNADKNEDASGVSEANAGAESSKTDASADASADSNSADSNEDNSAESALKRDNRPLGYDQQVEVKTTLTRGPMFSEVR